jgi:hypothetical protein
MATYQVTGSYATFKDYGTGVGTPVEMIAFVTAPTGVFCEYAVPLETFQLAGGNAGEQPDIQALTDAIEDVCSQVDCIVGGSFVQDTNPASGQLDDFVRFYLVYAPGGGIGPFSTFTDVPVSDFVVASNFSGGVIGSQLPGTNPGTKPLAACAALKALAG